MDISIRNVLNYYYHHPQQMRHEYNEFIRTTDLIDGCIDFDLALRDPDRVWRDWFCYAAKYSSDFFHLEVSGLCDHRHRHAHNPTE